AHRHAVVSHHRDRHRRRVIPRGANSLLSLSFSGALGLDIGLGLQACFSICCNTSAEMSTWLGPIRVRKVIHVASRPERINVRSGWGTV
ncbi:unnamed protein product, partial [Musa acuminata subsp. burmannicoides]